MAIVYKTIGSGGGYDYGTVAAFEAAIPADTTDQWIGICQLDEVIQSSWLNFNVSNANNMDHTVDALLAVRHSHDFSGARFSTSGVSRCLDIRTNNIHFKNIAFEQTGTTSVFLAYTGGVNYSFVNCFMKSNGGTFPTAYNSVNAGGDSTWESCDIVQSSASISNALREDGAGTMTVTNCVLVNNGGGVTAGEVLGGDASWGIINANNNKVFHTNASTHRKCFDASGGTINGDNNVSNDTTAPGADSTHSVTILDHVTDVTDGSEDLSMNVSGFNQSDFHGGDQLAGQADVADTDRPAGYIDIGSDQQSEEPTGSGYWYTGKRALMIGIQKCLGNRFGMARAEKAA